MPIFSVPFSKTYLLGILLVVRYFFLEYQFSRYVCFSLCIYALLFWGLVLGLMSLYSIHANSRFSSISFFWTCGLLTWVTITCDRLHCILRGWVGFTFYFNYFHSPLLCLGLPTHFDVRIHFLDLLSLPLSTHYFTLLPFLSIFILEQMYAVHGLPNTLFFSNIKDPYLKSCPPLVMVWIDIWSYPSIY